MVFSSQLFIFYFLPLTLLVYYGLPRRGKHLFLTIASYVFYGWANPGFALLMLLSTVIDYCAGLIISGSRIGHGPPRPLDKGVPRTRVQKTMLVVSIGVSLSLLGFFKYFNFATENYNQFISWLGFPDFRLDHILRITLPLGISFYTFKTISYTIDVYRGETGALRNFVDFACFVAMFPQLVAGPIIRFSHISEQLRSRSYTMETFARGIAFFSMGFAKKILLANPCGKIADTVFGAGSAGVIDSWYGLFAYAFQIYFDFSGYSDMAIGLGLMFGFSFPKNFDAPYRSQSISEFWRRWHISLSSWLRDYLFLPIAYSISRRIEADRVFRMKTETFIYAGATLITMLLAGLWHGAAWHFVMWGAFHGVFLVIDRMAGRGGLLKRFPRPARVAGTFLLVLFSWILFRAENLPEAGRYVSGLFGFSPVHPESYLLGGLIHNPYYLLTLLAAAVVTWGGTPTWEWTRQLPLTKAIACLLLLWLSLATLSSQAYNPFIYFIF